MGLPQSGKNIDMIARREFSERQSQRIADQTHARQRPLDRNRVALDK
jgi:hypothetical protein